MKLWQKIYLFSLLILIVAVNSTGIILIQNLHNSLLNKEIEKSMSEEKLLARELKINCLYYERYLSIYNKTLFHGDFSRELLQDGEIPYKGSINEIVKDYIETSACTGKIQVVDMEDKIIYTDLDFPVCQEKNELEGLDKDEIHYILKSLGSNEYVFFCSLSEIGNSLVKIYYAKDITSVYEERKKNYSVFIKLDIWMCSLFAIFMLFISKSISRPIEALTTSTNKIADGNYNERVSIHSKDELGVLSKDFNRMAMVIEQQIKDLKQANEEKEAFINNFTHELKTPLTSIIGYADVLRTSKYDESLFLEASNYIYNEGKHLEKIAFKMMDLIYAKTQTLKLERVEMQEVFDEVEMGFRQRVKENQIHVVTEGNSVYLMADKILIKMLLMNLVDNAIKASRRGSSIFLKAVVENNQTVLYVEDEGIGISQEYIDRLCEPFYVVDPARTKKNGGAGIGMAICQKIAQVHQAKLKIESALGKGTSISISFKNE